MTAVCAKRTTGIDSCAMTFDGRAVVLRNGSARDRPLPQVLEPQQHGQHPFELAI
jgi:hypothetical protein